jgi:hypothetical protein
MADEGQRVARGTAGRVVEDRDVVHGQHCRLRAWCESAADRAARVVRVVGESLGAALAAGAAAGCGDLISGRRLESWGLSRLLADAASLPN